MIKITDGMIAKSFFTNRICTGVPGTQNGVGGRNIRLSGLASWSEQRTHQDIARAIRGTVGRIGPTHQGRGNEMGRLRHEAPSYTAKGQFIQTKGRERDQQGQVQGLIRRGKER